MYSKWNDKIFKKELMFIKGLTKELDYVILSTTRRNADEIFNCE